VRVAILGGTGRFGSVLGWRLAEAGHHVILGSRDPLRAAAAAALLGALTQSGAPVEGAANADAVRHAEVVLVTVPDAGHRDVLRAVAGVAAGKVVIDTCVCHHPRVCGAWVRPAEGSAAARARRWLPRTATVAAALHTVGTRSLRWPRRHPPGDVLVAAEGPAALEAAGEVCEALGLRWWEAGDLRVAAALEQLACLLARLSEHHGVPSPAVRIHGLPERQGGRGQPQAELAGPVGQAGR
jgi:NADPH-dependent F420 reductase